VTRLFLQADVDVVVKFEKEKIPDSFDRSDVLNTNMIENARVPQIPGLDTICNTRVVLAGVLQRTRITLGELNYTLFSGIMKRTKM
jgi:hypothetical protein